MIRYVINDTTAYHVHGLDTLGWELTVCNALDPRESPCRQILKNKESYGNLLYDYLARFIPLSSLRTIIEIGGGYGCLMRDFLNRNRNLQATMLDISPRLLERQRLTLDFSSASFIEADILNVPVPELKSYDMAVLNECLGDLPTISDVPRDALFSNVPIPDPELEQTRSLLNRYAVGLSEDALVNVNIGALRVLENLCLARIPFIFMSEHSCEAAVPESLQKVVQVRPTGRPQRIRLKGHDEYTIRFSDLEKISKAFSYRIIRGHFADFLTIDFTDKLIYAMRAKSARTDEQEIIRQFVEDLYQYEYLILINGQDNRAAG